MNSASKVARNLLRVMPAFALAFAAHVLAAPQQYDAYGRPLPSVEELCKQGQMAGGPVTQTCAEGQYIFNRKGERLVPYNFDRWGYNTIDAAVTEADAERIDTDEAFRAKYIKSHGYTKYWENRTGAAADKAKLCNKDAIVSMGIAQEADQGATEDETLAGVDGIKNLSDAQHAHLRELVHAVYKDDRGNTPALIAGYVYNDCMSRSTSP